MEFHIYTNEWRNVPPGLHISNMKLFTGPLELVKQQNPHIFKKSSVPPENMITRKLGFPAVINPSEYTTNIRTYPRTRSFKCVHCCNLKDLSWWVSSVFMPLYVVRHLIAQEIATINVFQNPYVETHENNLPSKYTSFLRSCLQVWDIVILSLVHIHFNTVWYF